MENDIIDSITDLGYEGPLLDEVSFAKALEGGPKSLEYTKLIHILAEELKKLCNLEETVSMMNDPDESSSFLLELSSFLKELGCPYKHLTTGHMSSRLQTKEDRLLLLDYLISELMAARMVRIDRPKEKSAGMEIIMQESPTAKDLKEILIALKFNKPPPNISVEMLFTKLEAKLKETIQKEGDKLVGKPLYNKALSEKEWKQLETAYNEMFEEYRLRREMLITRLECTVQSCEWSDRLKHKKDQIQTVYRPKREPMRVKPDIRLSDFLAARTSLLQIEKTSSASVRKNTRSDVNKVIIGQVPDRGGRPNEQQPPPPEMPSWQQRSGGPQGGRGGGRGGGGGGRGGGGGGGRGGRVQGGYNQGSGDLRSQTSQGNINPNQRGYQTFEVPPGGYGNQTGYAQTQGGYGLNQGGYAQNQSGYGGQKSYDNRGGYNGKFDLSSYSQNYPFEPNIVARKPDKVLESSKRKLRLSQETECSVDKIRRIDTVFLDRDVMRTPTAKTYDLSKHFGPKQTQPDYVAADFEPQPQRRDYGLKSYDPKPVQPNYVTESFETQRVPRDYGIKTYDLRPEQRDYGTKFYDPKPVQGDYVTKSYDPKSVQRDYGAKSFDPKPVQRDYVTKCYDPKSVQRDYGAKSSDSKPVQPDYVTESLNPKSVQRDYGIRSFDPKPVQSDYVTESFNPKSVQRDYGIRSFDPKPVQSDYVTESFNPKSVQRDYATKSFDPKAVQPNYVSKSFEPQRVQRDYETKSFDPIPVQRDHDTRSLHSKSVQPEYVSRVSQVSVTWETTEQIKPSTRSKNFVTWEPNTKGISHTHTIRHSETIGWNRQIEDYRNPNTTFLSENRSFGSRENMYPSIEERNQLELELEWESNVNRQSWSNWEEAPKTQREICWEPRLTEDAAPLNEPDQRILQRNEQNKHSRPSMFNYDTRERNIKKDPSKNFNNPTISASQRGMDVETYVEPYIPPDSRNQPTNSRKTKWQPADDSNNTYTPTNTFVESRFSSYVPSNQFDNRKTVEKQQTPENNALTMWKSIASLYDNGRVSYLTRKRKYCDAMPERTRQSFVNKSHVSESKRSKQNVDPSVNIVTIDIELSDNDETFEGNVDNVVDVADNIERDNDSVISINSSPARSNDEHIEWTTNTIDDNSIPQDKVMKDCCVQVHFALSNQETAIAFEKLYKTHKRLIIDIEEEEKRDFSDISSMFIHNNRQVSVASQCILLINDSQRKRRLALVKSKITATYIRSSIRETGSAFSSLMYDHSLNMQKFLKDTQEKVQKVQDEICCQKLVSNNIALQQSQSEFEKEVILVEDSLKDNIVIEDDDPIVVVSSPVKDTNGAQIKNISEEGLTKDSCLQTHFMSLSKPIKPETQRTIELFLQENSTMLAQIELRDLEASKENEADKILAGSISGMIVRNSSRDISIQCVIMDEEHNRRRRFSLMKSKMIAKTGREIIKSTGSVKEFITYAKYCEPSLNLWKDFKNNTTNVMDEAQLKSDTKHPNTVEIRDVSAKNETNIPKIEEKTIQIDFETTKIETIRQPEPIMKILKDSLLQTNLGKANKFFKPDKRIQFEKELNQNSKVLDDIINRDLEAKTKSEVDEVLDRSISSMMIRDGSRDICAQCALISVDANLIRQANLIKAKTIAKNIRQVINETGSAKDCIIHDVYRDPPGGLLWKKNKVTKTDTFEDVINDVAVEMKLNKSCIDTDDFSIDQPTNKACIDDEFIIDQPSTSQELLTNTILKTNNNTKGDVKPKVIVKRCRDVCLQAHLCSYKNSIKSNQKSLMDRVFNQNVHITRALKKREEEAFQNTEEDEALNRSISSIMLNEGSRDISVQCMLIDDRMRTKRIYAFIQSKLTAKIIRETIINTQSKKDVLIYSPGVDCIPKDRKKNARKNEAFKAKAEEIKLHKSWSQWTKINKK